MKPSHKTDIIRLHKEGKSYSQIQALLGCSKGTIAYHLGPGQKEKTRDRTTKQRTRIRKFLQQYKQERTCADCKENYPYWIMEFDHLANKHFTIAQFHRITSNLDVIKEEVAKCEVVCSNCHKQRTYTRRVEQGANMLNIDEFYV